MLADRLNLLRPSAGSIPPAAPSRVRAGEARPGPDDTPRAARARQGGQGQVRGLGRGMGVGGLWVFHEGGCQQVVAASRLPHDYPRVVWRAAGAGARVREKEQKYTRADVLPPTRHRRAQSDYCSVYWSSYCRCSRIQRWPCAAAVLLVCLA